MRSYLLRLPMREGEGGVMKVERVVAIVLFVVAFLTSMRFLIGQVDFIQVHAAAIELGIGVILCTKEASDA